MDKKKDIEYWIIDTKTYHEVQKIKRYVDFVSELEFTSLKDKEKAEEVKFLIENIDKPEYIKEWCVCLDIYNWEVQSGHGKGIYWRGWRVWFELGKLEIEAFYHILDKNHITDDYAPYYGCINFKKEIKGNRINLDTDLDVFIADLVNYKNYLTDALNEIEIEIDSWDRINT